MTTHDVSLLLCALGCTYLATAWIGRRTGDARRDAHLALGAGIFLLACGGWIVVAYVAKQFIVWSALPQLEAIRNESGGSVCSVHPGQRRDHVLAVRRQR